MVSCPQRPTAGFLLGLPFTESLMKLKELRIRLSDIDQQLLQLIAERQSIVDEVGKFKRSEGRATRDFAREKDVIDGARAQAQSLGLAPDLAEQLMTMLITSSLTKQERARVKAEGRGSGRRALVIGGAGKMGQWFVNFLDSQGYQVMVADPIGSVDGVEWISDWRQTSNEFALTVIAAPLSKTADILSQMAAKAWSGLVFDVGSLKSPLIPGLRELAASGCQVTSVHPMFGPDTELLSDKHVLFLDAGCADATAAARQLFDATMALQTEMTLEGHDRLIAYVLGLSHALNIAFFSVLAESGEHVPRLAKISSTTFDAQLDVATRVAEENPHLYFEIQSLNDFGMEPIESLQAAVEKIALLVRGDDEQGFVKLMESGRAYLEGRQ